MPPCLVAELCSFCMGCCWLTPCIKKKKNRSLVSGITFRIFIRALLQQQTVKTCNWALMMHPNKPPMEADLREAVGSCIPLPDLAHSYILRSIKPPISLVQCQKCSAPMSKAHLNQTRDRVSTRPQMKRYTSNVQHLKPLVALIHYHVSDKYRGRAKPMSIHGARGNAFQAQGPLGVTTSTPSREAWGVLRQVTVKAQVLTPKRGETQKPAIGTTARKTAAGMVFP